MDFNQCKTGLAYRNWKKEKNNFDWKCITDRKVWTIFFFSFVVFLCVNQMWLNDADKMRLECLESKVFSLTAHEKKNNKFWPTESLWAFFISFSTYSVLLCCDHLVKWIYDVCYRSFLFECNSIYVIDLHNEKKRPNFDHFV